MNKDRVTEYIRSGGVKCPYCGSEEIEGGSIEIDEGRAVQSITCLNCDKFWDDIYSLSGIHDEEEAETINAEPNQKKHFYIIVVWDGIDPERFGPFDTEAMRDKEAKRLKNIGTESSDIFSLDIISEKEPPVLVEVRGYSEEFFTGKES